MQCRRPLDVHKAPAGTTYRAPKTKTSRISKQIETSLFSEILTKSSNANK